MRLPTLPSVGHFAKSLTVLLSLSLVNPAVGGSLPRTDSKSCDNSPKDSPRHFGFLLPRAFDILDVFGPLEVFQAVARRTQLQLYLLSRTLDPALTSPVNAAMNPFNSSFFPQLLPTHTYDDNPPIDVLVVPGGAAARSPDLGPEIDYIKRTFPQLKYFITICTGAGIAAQSGVLDGHRATTNKSAWNVTTAYGPNVKWVSPARWVEDGKVWSSSGVTSGIDLAFEFVKQKYENGAEIADTVAGNMEHRITTDWRDDPFADKYNVPVSN